MENPNKYSFIKGSLGTYRPEETDDGTLTLFSEYFQEACHSHAGAREETLYYYVHGTKVAERLKLGPLSVFEVGFGTGLGLLTTLEATDITDRRNLFFLSCELDELLAKYSLEQLRNQNYVDSFEKKKLASYSYFDIHLVDGGRAFVLIGDIRESLLAWRSGPFFKPIQAIYHDPFSPKRNPRLWTIEWFSQLKAVSSNEVILATYSATKAVWKAMIAGGWNVSEIRGFGSKKLSTQATLEGESSQSVVSMCEKSPMEALSDATIP